MEFIRIGRITGTHGLDGTLRIAPITDNPQIYAEIKYLMLAKDGSVVKSLEIGYMQEHKNALLIQVDGVMDKESALELKGLDVVVPASMLPEEDEGEVYWSRIQGSEVYDTEDRFIGTLDDYIETGTSDVFRIKGDKGSFLVSNNPDHVLRIDARNKKLLINREGLVSEEV
ncbi:ribosome maturation factor RimM [Limisalsivibrio acetivorans]|uniref:ribosome maturation factor RimM n=1 Tax=Limisalsivibrio acetivorans TaxID=1304888 RepID=UPI0004201DD8|nr:ribosome maturation factor RimM [Limisalsivibrio acetivorans]